MSMKLYDVLMPVRASSPKAIRELEVLRVSARFPKSIEVTSARREVLAWAQRRSGGRLPVQAWDGDTFEYFSGGRTTVSARISASQADVWALRVDDPDKQVPGRVWTTEVTIGSGLDESPRLGVRLLASTAEESLDIEPHVPGFVQQLADNCGLLVGTIPVRPDGWTVSSQVDVENLISLLQNPDRRRPVFVATGDERSANPDDPLVDIEVLARATAGLAHVVVVPARYTIELTHAFGRSRSVFHGGVRTYLPGFDAGSNPYEHRLFLSEALRTQDGALRCVRTLRQFAAKESLLRFRINTDVLTFAEIRNASLRLERERQVSDGADDSERLRAAQAQIQALEDELKKSRDWEEQLVRLHDEAEERAIAAEAQLRGSISKVNQLHDQLLQKEGVADSTITFPTSWTEVAEWCDENLVGRLVISPAARRSLKKAEFSDIELAMRCLIWLAGECRDRRIEGGGSVSEHPIEDGVRNSSCGSDSYEFDFQGQRLEADWHVKNGGNTRDPTRCLRIYYAWDPQSLQIVVSDMPTHLRTGAS